MFDANLDVIINLLQQEGYLCAQHCLNALLQGQYFNAVDLANLADQLDTKERLAMAEIGEDTDDYKRFIEVTLMIRLNHYHEVINIKQ